MPAVRGAPFDDCVVDVPWFETVVGRLSSVFTVAGELLFTSTLGSDRMLALSVVASALINNGIAKPLPRMMPPVRPCAGFVKSGRRVSGSPSPSVSWNVDWPNDVKPNGRVKLPLDLMSM